MMYVIGISVDEKVNFNRSKTAVQEDNGHAGTERTHDPCQLEVTVKKASGPARCFA